MPSASTAPSSTALPSPSPSLSSPSPATPKLRRILIANRGEIAMRVIHACHDTGRIAIAAYADPDADALFVHAADEAYALGGSDAQSTYLNIAAIVETAHKAHVDAVHPGYGFLFRAARHLSDGKEGRPARALVVTGFYIPKAAQPAAETDGPLGALEVCMALRAIGGDAWLVSDECCAPVIRPSALGFLPDDHVLIAPNANPKGGFDAWLNGAIDLAKTEHIDTLVYIERVGPARDGSPHNMRGIDITEWTAPLSQLTLLGLHTIGVGDGGNEIGMGRVEDYAIEGVVDHGENIACTVPTDQLVVAGTSNWGAHALVCAMRALGSNAVDPYLEPTWQERVLDVIVEYGGLDGVHMTNVATVDGLEPDRYFKQVGQLTDCARS